MPQPVVTRFSTSGSESVLAAFKSIEQAAQHAARATQQANTTANKSNQQLATATKAAAAANVGAQKQAVALTKEQERAQKQANAAAIQKSKIEQAALGVERQRVKLETDKVRLQREQLALARMIDRVTTSAAKKAANQNGATSTGGRSGFSQSKAMKSIFGKEMVWGTMGGVASVAAGALLFKGAIETAAGALHQFGTFLISDVLAPAIAAKRGAAQMANRGYGTAAGALGDVTALAGAHHTTKEKAQAALGAAFDITRNAGTAKGVAGTALSMSRAYGIEDVEGLTTRLARLRVQMKGLNDKEFAQFSDIMVAQSKGGGLSIDAQTQISDSVMDLANKFAEGGAGGRSRNIQGIQGIVGISAAETGNAQKSMSSFAQLIAEAQEKRIGTNSQGQIADVNAVIPAVLAKFGGDARKMRAGGLSEDVITFLKPFAETFKQSGAGGLQAAIASSGTAMTSERNSIGKDEGAVAETAEEKFAMALEHLKGQFGVLAPSLESLIDVLIANKPQIEAMIQEGLIPLGVAMIDLAGAVLGNINPSFEVLGGLMDLLAASMRIALVPLTIIPAAVYGLVAAFEWAMAKITFGDSSKEHEAAAAKYGKIAKDLSVGGFEQLAVGGAKIGHGIASFHGDQGAHATVGPYVPGERRGPPVTSGGFSLFADGSTLPPGHPAHPGARAATVPTAGMAALDKSAAKAAIVLGKIGMLDPKRFLPVGAPDRSF